MTRLDDVRARTAYLIRSLTETVEPTDRQLLVDVRQWALDNGWHLLWSGWANAMFLHDATVLVEWDDEELTVRRRDKAGEPWAMGLAPDRRDRYPVASVRQAFDILAALGILPPEFSSAYRAACKIPAGLLPAEQAVIDAARVWRWSGDTADVHHRAKSALMAAVDALPGRPEHGPDALPHGYVPGACGDRCNNGRCPAGNQMHDRCTEACVAGPR